MNVANESVQIFGGVGMTDEYDIGFFLKRARAAELAEVLHGRSHALTKKALRRDVHERMRAAVEGFTGL